MEEATAVDTTEVEEVEEFEEEVEVFGEEEVHGEIFGADVDDGVHTGVAGGNMEATLDTMEVEELVSMEEVLANCEEGSAEGDET